MRKATPEAWLTIVFIIAFTVIPILIGWLAVKIYRIRRPFPKQEHLGLASIGQPTGDGFFKVLLVGWIICGPIYYWLYSSGIFE